METRGSLPAETYPEYLNMNKRYLAVLGALLSSTGMVLAQASSPGPGELMIATPPSFVDAPRSWGPGGNAGAGAKEDAFWTSAEYLMYWVKSAPLPTPLATSGDPAGAAASGLTLGALGTPGTSVLSPHQQDYGPQSGGRVSAGWLDSEGFLGFQASGFLLETRSASFAVNSNPGGSPALSVPFLSPVTGTETALNLSAPGVAQGGVLASSTNALWGAEANGLLEIFNDHWLHAYALCGFRYFDLAERLDVTDFSTSPVAPATTGLTGPAPAVPATFRDFFSTHNQLYAGQMGIQTEARFDRFFIDCAIKVAMGDSRQSIVINGTTTALPPLSGGGVFTEGTNIGRFTRTQFAVAPEAKLQAGFDFTRNIRAFAGYEFLYLTKVIRPGYQLDHQVDLTQSPFFGGPGASSANSTNPAQMFNSTNFWAQGINAGIQISF
jgi:Putative beta barrel porin-7 (BBP7)